MSKLLLIGGSNYLSQELIKTIPESYTVVAVSINEDTDRHRKFLKLEQKNLHKEILNITKGNLFWLDNLIKKYDYFDSMIYFPMSNSRKQFLNITNEDFQKAVDVNGKLPFLISQKLIPGMIGTGHGRFVFISSIWSIKGNPKGSNEYAITKVMLNQLSKQITASFIEKNITSTTLIFGSVNLHLRNDNDALLFTEKDRVISHKEIAEFIFILLDQSRRSFAGNTVLIDNGVLSTIGVH